jgi:hypothetical protein
MAEEHQIYFPNEIDYDNLKVGNLKSNAKGGKVSNISYQGKFFRIQGPEMFTPFGVNAYAGQTGENFDKPVFNVQLSYGSDERKSLSVHRALHEKIDTMIVDEMMRDCPAWVGEPLSPEQRIVAEKMYKSSINISRDKNTGKPLDYPATFRIKIPYAADKKQFTCPIYDENQKELDLNDFRVDDRNASPQNMITFPKTKGAKFVPIYKLSVWKVGGKVSSTCVVEQLQMRLPKRLTGHAIRKNDDDMIPDGGTGDNFVPDASDEGPSQTNVTSVTQNLGSLQVEDSDDGEP